MWSDRQLKQHLQAANSLVVIKKSIAIYLQKNEGILEYEVTEEVRRLFREHGLVMDGGHRPIVAFGKNTSYVHYFAPEKGSLPLQKETLILLDIWGRLREPRAPYADFTWMLYYGNDTPDKGYAEAFTVVRDARDTALRFIQKNVTAGRCPLGRECDEVARKFLEEKKCGPFFLHALGHSLGTKSPHGIYGGPRPRTKSPLVPMLGYTIEPGVYFQSRFGVRSEIDFYIEKNGEVVITLPLQKKIEVIRVI